MSIARIIVGEHAGQNVVVVYKYERSNGYGRCDDLLPRTIISLGLATIAVGPEVPEVRNAVSRRHNAVCCAATAYTTPVSARGVSWG